MKILLLADEPDPILWEHLDRRRLEGISLVLSAGDLPASYLEFLTCFTSAPIVYIHGNHDTKYDDTPPGGCMCAEDRVLTVEGVRILGLGGSMRYKPGEHQYSEKEMRRRIRKLWFKLRRSKGFDILLAHAPMRGWGDQEDRCHLGFMCFSELIEKYHPRYFVHGHVHANYSPNFKRERVYDEHTTIVNAWKSCVIEYEKEN